MVALPPWHPQRRFCAAVLEREVRLAYWDKVRETLPDALAALMPPQPGPAFPYGPPQGDHPPAAETESALAQQLTGLVRNKKSSKEVGAHPRRHCTPQGLHRCVSVLGPLCLFLACFGRHCGGGHRRTGTAAPSCLATPCGGGMSHDGPPSSTRASCGRFGCAWVVGLGRFRRGCARCVPVHRKRRLPAVRTEGHGMW